MCVVWNRPQEEVQAASQGCLSQESSATRHGSLHTNRDLGPFDLVQAVTAAVGSRGTPCQYPSLHYILSPTLLE